MNRRPRQPLAVERKQPPVIRDFVYSAGRVVESVPLMARAPRGGAAKGQIHLVVDIDGSPTGPSADQLRDSFTQYFYRSASRSITSTLQHAVQHLNEEMLADNRRSLRKERNFATLACAVIRNEDVYVALAGRAVYFAVGPSGSERFGRGDPRHGEGPVDLVGQVEDIGVELFHRSVSDLSELVLSSSGIVDLGDESFEQLLKKNDGTVSDLVRRLASRHRGKRRFSAAVLSFGETADDPDRDRPVTRVPPPKARRPVTDDTIYRISPSARSVAREQINGVWARLFANPPRRVASPDLEGTSVERPMARRPPRRPLTSTIVDREMAGFDEPGLSEASKFPTPVKSRTMTLPPGARWPTIRPLELISSTRFPRRTMRIGLIGVAVLALFYLGYLASQVPLRIIRESSDAATAIGKLAEAEQRERDALSQTDPMARRRMLDEASQLASQASIERPESAAAATASARIRSEYQTATGTTRLGAPTKVVDLPTSADEMVLVNPDLFVLDRANSRVYSFLLNVDGTTAQSSSNPVLVRKGDHVGAATVGDLTHIAWIPAGNGRKSNDLVILDTAGFLLQYEPTRGLSLLALRDPESWKDTLSIRGFDGNLYALSANRKKLTVYPAQPSAYDGDATDYFTGNVPVNLTDPVSFAVDKDLFLVHGSGRIESFTNGVPNSFVGPPDDMAPRNPAGVSVSADSVFVGDPARSRVIQLTRTGDFQRSLSVDDSGPLANVRDLAVSDDGQALYVLSDRTMYRFILPK